MKLLPGVIVLASLGCGAKQPEPPPTNGESGSAKTKVVPLLKACNPPSGGMCNWAYCGGNSALINAFPINGFRPDGECNEDEIQVVPGSLNGPNCVDATLDIENGKLVGRRDDKNCVDDDLKGASFEVRTTKDSERITITDVTKYGPNSAEQFPAYRMEWKLNGKTQGLCAKEGQQLLTKLGASTMKFSDDLPAETADLIVPIVSELYDLSGTAIDPPRSDWAVQKLEWNNLACVDDALAKRFYSHLQTSDVQKTRAALRMWTGDYCGGNPFTMRGELIQWVYDPQLEVEARWDANGAKCLSAPRILRDEHGNETYPKKLTKRLKGMCKHDHKSDCNKKADWLDIARHCTIGENGTSNATQAHTIPLCSGQCDPNVDPSCAPQSQIVKQ